MPDNSPATAPLSIPLAVSAKAGSGGLRPLPGRGKANEARRSQTAATENTTLAEIPIAVPPFPGSFAVRFDGV